MSKDRVHMLCESALSLFVYGSVLSFGVSFWWVVLHMAFDLMP